MSKITKKLYDDYKATKQVVKKAKSEHEKNVNQIIEIIKPLLPKVSKAHVEITGIEFRNDDCMKDKPTTYEWVEISETAYYKIYQEENYNYWNSRNKKESKVKEEYIYEPEFKIVYYKLEPVKYQYLRVYIEETWAYGGYDALHYDFLLSDIMDQQYLRKEKLKKLEEIS